MFFLGLLCCLWFMQEESHDPATLIRMLLPDRWIQVAMDKVG